MATVANHKGAGSSNKSALMRLVKGVPAPVPTPAPGKKPKGKSLKQVIAEGEADFAAGRGVTMTYEEYSQKYGA